VAQRGSDPAAACFRISRRQTKSRAEWVEAVIRGDKQFPLRRADRSDLNVGIHMTFLEKLRSSAFRIKRTAACLRTSYYSDI
jgi:hypothetical protein